MKKLNKVFLFLSVLAVIFGFTACTKDPVITNTDESVEALTGEWSMKLRSEMVLYADPTDIDSAEGNVIAICDNVLILNADRTFELKSNQYLESFEPFFDDCVYTEQDVIDMVNSKSFITGKFNSDEKLFQMINEKIAFNDEESVNFEEVEETSVITFKYKLNEDKLSFEDYNDPQLKTEYVRVNAQ